MSEHLKALLATAKSVLSNREIPLELRALSASFYLIEYLEAQESEAKSRTTESPTTEASSAAGTSGEHSIRPGDLAVSEMAFTEARTPLLQRLLGVLMEAERIHVDQCSECAGRMGRFGLLLGTHVRDAAGTTSTSPKPESPQSVADSGSAKSGSSESSSVPVDKLEALIEEWWETRGYERHRDQWKRGTSAAYLTAADMLRDLLPALVEEVEG